MQTVIPRPQRRLLSPLEIANLAAWYDVGLTASTTSSDIRIDSSNRVSLIADKSGNSAVNCLCLNGSGGNFASIPDSNALDFTTELDVRVDLSAVNWAGSAFQSLAAKWQSSGQFSWTFDIENLSAGRLSLYISQNGTATGNVSSSVGTGFSAYARRGVRVTWRGSDGRVQFFTRADSSITSNTGWTQLGTDRTIATLTTLFNSTSRIEIGANTGGSTNPLTGNIYQVWASGTIDGTAALYANFTAASKLATSFTESSSNAATVTINSSGDLGARISGERDLVQLTAAKQPIYLPWSGTNYGYLSGAGSFTTPDSAAASVTGDIDIRVYAALNDWTPSSTQTLVSKYLAGAGGNSYSFDLLTSGNLNLTVSIDGTAFSAVNSGTATGIADRAAKWVRATRVAATGAVSFFLSDDGVTWSALGSGGTSTTGNIFDSTTQLAVGAGNNATASFVTGNIYRAQVLNGIGGTVVADFNPALYTSGTTFTASTGEVWTLNGGSTIVNRTSLYFDGSDDYMANALHSLSQPYSGYFTGQQVSFTNGDIVFDGSTNDTIRLLQATPSPQVALYAGGGASATTSEWAIGTNAVVSVIGNGASSGVRVNRNAINTANIGTGGPNGITIGARRSGASPGNIRMSEFMLYSAAHDTTTQNSLITYSGAKWGISV